MRRYRLLIYDGDPDWLAMKPHSNEFIKSNQPYICGKGSVHSMELKPSSEMAKDDLFLSGMMLLETLADEQVEQERKEPEDDHRN